MRAGAAADLAVMHAARAAVDGVAEAARAAGGEAIRDASAADSTERTATEAIERAGSEATAGSTGEPAADGQGMRAGIVVGLSGGADSACLTHALARLAAQACVALVAVHVNHMLRGLDADRDMAAADALCSSIGVPFKAVCVDVAALARRGKSSTEAAGREARYAAFEAERAALARRLRAPAYVAVAHNREDLAETTLMNALRGAGVDGVAAMARGAGDTRVIRPLLGVSRRDIELYCALHGLAPARDGSNYDPAYTRNRVRNELMPLVRAKVNPNADAALARLAMLAARDSEYLWMQARAAFHTALGASDGAMPASARGRGALALSASAIADMHPAISSRVMLLACAQALGGGNAHGMPRDIRQEHIERAIRLADKPGKPGKPGTPGAPGAPGAHPSAGAGAPGKAVCLPGGLRACKTYRDIVVYKAGAAGDAPAPQLRSAQRASISKSFHTKDGLIIEQMGNIRYNSNIQYFDADAAMSGESAGSLELRRRLPGDRFFPIRSPGSKPLKDYFIDEKIPADERGAVFLLADGKEIVWVVGYRISDRYKVTGSTRTVMRVEFCQADAADDGGSS